MITGKNKEQFKKWYILKFLGYENLLEVKHEYNYFNEIDFEMQIGVYLAYYDSLGIYIEAFMFETPKDWNWQIYGDDIMSPLFKMAEGDIIETYNSRNESLKEAFKKADEIINNN